jgi:glycosyltransferase involved in cell wall biosynthesis
VRIGIVTQHPFPGGYDYRCTLIAETLAAGGHRVTVFTPNPRIQREPAENSSAVTVKSPSAPRLLVAPLPFNLYWAGWLAREGRRHRLDCLLSKELRLAPSTWLAARWCGAKFWIDLSENYPAMVETQRAGQRFLTLMKSVAALLEGFCTRSADLVTVVTASNANRIVKLGVPEKCVSVVSNTPVLKEFPSPSGTADSDKVRLVFCGLLTRIRGLDRLLLAASSLDGARGRLLLDIIGDGPEAERLRGLARSLGLADCVSFLGWVPREQLASVLVRYDVGVIPHLLNEHTQTTIPTKLFDYMACELPVWATAMAPCIQVIEESKCGWVSSDDQASMTATLRAILHTPAPDLRAMGARGRQAVQERYNWSVDGGRMLKAIALLREPPEHHHEAPVGAQLPK